MEVIELDGVRSNTKRKAEEEPGLDGGNTSKTQRMATMEEKIDIILLLSLAKERGEFPLACYMFFFCGRLQRKLF